MENISNAQLTGKQLNTLLQRIDSSTSINISLTIIQPEIEPINVYCDGSFSNAPSVIGWAWVNDKGRTAKGRIGRKNRPPILKPPVELNPTVAEIIAVCQAIDMHPHTYINIYTDSNDVMRCVNGGPPTKNPAIKRVYAHLQQKIANNKRYLTFVKIKGHNGNEMHNKAHDLANTARKHGNKLQHKKPPERSTK